MSNFTNLTTDSSSFTDYDNFSYMLQQNGRMVLQQNGRGIILNGLGPIIDWINSVGQTVTNVSDKSGLSSVFAKTVGIVTNFIDKK